ncbi:MAG: acyl-CoA dehydrogenase [Pseudomonadota bacterium]
MTYAAPAQEIAFALESVAGLADAREAGAINELSSEDTLAILTEAARFAEEVLAPLNTAGDHHHSTLRDGEVSTPPGWKEAYAAWVEAGWGSLTGDPAHGGQGLPMALQVAATDIWNQANSAFALNPLLTIGAVEALDLHGSEALKATYLEKMISGAWTGTMNLTESHAGSDLSLLRTRAEPSGDGTYRLFGQKIYITYGEHDLSENIIHFVLARLPDAPEGTRGISLFLVPKVLVNADGTLGARNDVAAVGVEKKLGLHASPTCTMAYGANGEGALGYLVGEPNKGLAAMFVMMNNARVQVGMQGAAIAERAYQHAFAYAKERKQGRAPGHEGMAPIVNHPDVKRMLLSMKALTQASRAICYACAVAIDRGRTDPAWKARADLLTPIAKAFPTDVGVEVASIGIQVHGGMGYVEETGAAQYYRDGRIFPIYEGTNGIQAIDLIKRKITMDDGAVLNAYLSELSGIAEAARGANDLDLAAVARRLDEAVSAVSEVAGEIRAALKANDPAQGDRALAAATPFLRALGLTAGGAYLTKAALKAPNGSAEPRAALARFFAHSHVAGVPELARGSLLCGTDVAGASAEALAL